MSEKERDFLDEEQEVAAEPEVAEAVEPEKVDEVQEPETPEPETPATTAEEPKQEQHVPIAALLAERDKRQERERKLQEYEQELAKYRQQQEQPIPDFYEAPDQHIQALLSQHDQRVTQRMLGALEAQAREVYQDYDEVFAELEAQAQGNPALVQQVMQAPNPAMAAYKLGKQMRELKQMQDPDAYRQKIAAEERAKIEAEMAAKEQARLKTAQSLPPDLTASRGAKGNDLPPQETVFDEIF